MVYTTPEHNRFFSMPVSILPRPGPFSPRGAAGLEGAFRRAGFRRIEARVIPSPLRLPSTPGASASPGSRLARANR